MDSAPQNLQILLWLDSSQATRVLNIVSIAHAEYSFSSSPLNYTLWAGLISVRMPSVSTMQMYNCCLGFCNGSKYLR